VVKQKKKKGSEEGVGLLYVRFCVHVITFMYALLYTYSPLKFLWEILKFPSRFTSSANNPSTDTP